MRSRFCHGLGKAGTFLDRISETLSWIALAFFLVPIVLVVASDVFCRYVLNAPIKGALELSALMLVPVAFFTLSYCWVEGGHARVDFVVKRFGPRWQVMMNILAAASGLVVMSMLIWQLGADTLESIQFNELTHRLLLPVWPMRTLMTLGVALFIVQLVRSLILYVRQVEEGVR